ncbi:leucine-rich repeat isoform f [Anaeramoeba flamelloides]|uniref:Leucine-rich repeat isoform f n=1 Tax=Anaeramoeba flamelloides TaxID=1746091 RepID=A0AAV8AEW8_9EUKA|nr:leucine-rich repeat isoform f [Anaeramoeba flamelloides]
MNEAIKGFLKTREETSLQMETVDGHGKFKGTEFIWLLASHRIFIFTFKKKLKLFHESHLLEIESIQSQDLLNFTIKAANKEISFQTIKTDKILQQLNEQYSMITAGNTNESPFLIEIKPKFRSIRLGKIFRQDRKNVEANLEPAQKYVESYRAQCSLYNIKPNLHFIRYIYDQNLSNNQKIKKTLNLSNFKYIDVKNSHQCYLDLHPVFLALHHNSYYTKIILKSTNRNESLQLIADALTTNKTITSINFHLNGATEGFDAIALALKSNHDSNLKKINFSNLRPTDRSIQRFVQEIAYSKQGFSCFKLVNIGFKGKMIQSLFQSLIDNETNQKLKKLDLSENQFLKIGSKSFVEFLSNLSSNEQKIDHLSFSNIKPSLHGVLSSISSQLYLNLITLNLSSNSINNSCGKVLIDFLKKSNKLLNLNLSMTGISKKHFNSILIVIKNKSNAHKFSLNCEENSLGTKAALYLSAILESGKDPFQSLFIGGNNFGHKGCLAIFKSILNHKNLQILSIGRNVKKSADTSDLAQTVSQFFSQNKTVVRLDLSGYKNYKLQHDFALCFDSLNQNSSLQYLDLSHNCIGDQALLQLFGSVKENKSLLYLNWEDNDASVELLSHFKRILLTNKTLCKSPMPINSFKRKMKLKDLSLKNEIEEILANNSKENDYNTKNLNKNWNSMATKLVHSYSKNSEISGLENSENEKGGKNIDSNNTSIHEKNGLIDNIKKETNENDNKIEKGSNSNENENEMENENENRKEKEKEINGDNINKNQIQKEKEISELINKERSIEKNINLSLNETSDKEDILDENLKQMDEQLKSLIISNDLKQLVLIQESKTPIDLQVLDLKALKSPLHYACQIGNPFFLSYLLNHGCDIFINTADKQGFSPIHILFNESRNEECIQLLSDYGVRFNIRDKNGRTPLMYVIQNISSLHRNKHRSVFNLLVKKGAKINLLNKEGQSLLHLIAKFKGVELLKTLLKYQLDINKQDNNGNTPLHVAITFKDLEMVCLLLLNKANCFIRNKENQLPLDIAVKLNFEHAIEILQNSDNEKISEEDLTLAIKKKATQMMSIVIETRKYEEFRGKTLERDQQTLKKFDVQYQEYLKDIKIKEIKKKYPLKNALNGENNIKIQTVLNEDKLKFWFLKFLQSQYCDENLLFYDRIKQLSQINKQYNYMFQLASEAIYDDFLQDNAPKLVNVDFEFKQIIQKNLKERPIPRDVYNKSQQWIYQLLNQDSYPKFLRSNHYYFMNLVQEN